MPQQYRLFDVDPVAIALCKRGANNQRIFLRKSVDEAELFPVAAEMELHKASADDWTTLYCVVASPEVVENGGLLAPDVQDVWSAEEIRKAAHRLLKNKGVVNVEHAAGEADAHIVESAVALADIPLEGYTVPKGAWYIGIEPNAELRKSVEDGSVTGVSLEGTGVRQAVELAKSSDAEKQSIWRRLGEVLGVPLQGDSATVKQENPEEESEVTDVKHTELETKVDALATSQAATLAKADAATSAIEGLIGTVNKLVERLDSKKKEDETPDAKSLKKSIDDLTATFATKLDELESQVDKLGEGESTQSDKSDLKKTEAHWTSGIL